MPKTTVFELGISPDWKSLPFNSSVPFQKPLSNNSRKIYLDPGTIESLTFVDDRPYVSAKLGLLLKTFYCMVMVTLSDSYVRQSHIYDNFHPKKNFNNYSVSNQPFESRQIIKGSKVPYTPQSFPISVCNSTYKFHSQGSAPPHNIPSFIEALPVKIIIQESTKWNNRLC